jgi:hypothetical protein
VNAHERNLAGTFPQHFFAVNKKGWHASLRSVCDSVQTRIHNFPYCLDPCSRRLFGPEPRTLCGGSGLGIRRRSRFGHTSGAVRRLGIEMGTERDCPHWRSIETSPSHRRGTVERCLAPSPTVCFPNRRSPMRKLLFLALFLACL